jgi:hypothetical protein
MKLYYEQTEIDPREVKPGWEFTVDSLSIEDTKKWAEKYGIKANYSFSPDNHVHLEII